MNGQTLDVKEQQLIVGNTQITGGISGDWITFEKAQNSSFSTDAHGNSYLIKNYDNTITLTVMLSYGSESNNVLSTFANFGSPVRVKYNDVSSGTIIESLEAVVNINGGTLASNSEITRTWTIIMSNASVTANGLIKRGLNQ
jgi:hypothetical protein